MSYHSRFITKTIKTAVMVTAFSLASHLSFAENVTSILRASDEKKVADLEGYIAKNPNAEDASVAEAWLIRLYAELGQNEKAVTLMEKHLKQMDPAKTDVREYVSIVQQLFEGYVQLGAKDKARDLLDNTLKAYAQNPLAPQLGQFFEQMKGSLNRPGVGDVMEVAFKDLNGHDVDLAKLKGKVVLVDFWATWCGPCVGELPNVKKTYEQYHDKGFEIIAISLDEDKKALTDFIAKEAIAWPQAFDGKGWENDFAKKFGITGIPATFLIGKSGKIVATDLRGEDLGKAVKVALEAN